MHYGGPRKFVISTNKYKNNATRGGRMLKSETMKNLGILLILMNLFLQISFAETSSNFQKQDADKINKEGLDKITGAGSSGGGTYIKREDGSVILLDFYKYYPNLQDTFEFKKIDEIDLNFWSYVKGYSEGQLRTYSGLYKKLEKRFDSWQSTSPVLVNVIKSAVSQIKWKLSPYKVKKMYKGKEAVGVIYYYKEKGAVLDVDIWNRSGDLSKMGLLVHESLRHVNIFYNGNLSEDNIHYLTTRIILTDPENENDSLDKAELFKEGSVVNRMMKFHKELVTVTVELKNSMIEWFDSIKHIDRPDIVYKLKNIIFNYTADGSHKSILENLVRPIGNLQKNELDYLFMGNDRGRAREFVQFADMSKIVVMDIIQMVEESEFSKFKKDKVLPEWEFLLD